MSKKCPTKEMIDRSRKRIAKKCPTKEMIDRSRKRVTKKYKKLIEACKKGR